MGREAVIWVDVDGRSAEAKVVLEAAQLIVRAPIRRTVDVAAITEVRVDGDALHIRLDSSSVVLHLGAKAAASWAKALTTPAPSLREKLGLRGDARAILVGEVDDAALRSALEASTTTDRAAASMVVAVVDGPDALREGLVVVSDGDPLPMCVVYRKGRGVAFGEGPIREILRGEGFRDTKTCAVSERLTATRYHAIR